MTEVTEEEYTVRMMGDSDGGVVSFNDNDGAVLVNTSSRLDADDSQCVFKF